MRLWHYKLIPFLPDSQLRGQWSELNFIFKNKPKHILINYIYSYPTKIDLLFYSLLIIREMDNRLIKINNFKNMIDYFELTQEFNFEILKGVEPFEYHHNDRYLLQCFFNLQEKYDSGQKDFDSEKYYKIRNLVRNILDPEGKNIKIKRIIS